MCTSDSENKKDTIENCQVGVRNLEMGYRFDTAKCLFEVCLFFQDTCS